jgi:tetratricopeptide (TPR) repeat protein
LRALLLALAVLAWAPPAAAQDLQGRELARQHFKNGEAKFRAGDYRGAMIEFLAADAIAPSAILVHNVAVCQDRLGEVDAAMENYREYLRRRPDAPNRAEVETRVATLERTRGVPDVLPDDDALGLPRDQQPIPPSAPPRRAYDEAFARRVPTLSGGQAAAPPPAYPAPPPQPAPAPAPASPEPAKKEKPLYKQWWFWAFVGVGAIILIDIASSGDDDSSPAARPTGLTLIRF